MCEFEYHGASEDVISGTPLLKHTPSIPKYLSRLTEVLSDRDSMDGAGQRNNNPFPFPFGKVTREKPCARSIETWGGRPPCFVDSHLEHRYHVTAQVAPSGSRLLTARPDFF
jgi:hypothetical protein